MQTDILYKQLTTKLDELKTAIERFEKHTPPSTAYAEQLHTAINEANKLVSAYVVLKEQKDVSPDLNLHLKLMNVTSAQQEVKEQVKAEIQVEKSEVIETPKVEVVTPVAEVTPLEVVAPPIVEKKSVEIVFEKPEIKTYPKLAINLNDKFRFINELFAGNANEYNIAIEQFNTVNSMDEATAYIKGLKSIYNWNDDHEMVKNMNGLIQKRFLS
jgi:hypothetical protein